MTDFSAGYTAWKPQQSSLLAKGTVRAPNARGVYRAFKAQGRFGPQAVAAIEGGHFESGEGPGHFGLEGVGVPRQLPEQAGYLAGALVGHVAFGQKGIDAFFLPIVQLLFGAAQHEQTGAARGQHGQAHLFGQGQIAGIGHERCQVIHVLSLGSATAAPAGDFPELQTQSRGYGFKGHSGFLGGLSQHAAGEKGEFGLHTTTPLRRCGPPQSSSPGRHALQWFRCRKPPAGSSCPAAAG